MARSVNGSRVRGECELKNGDKLTIGPLEFEVCVRVGVAGRNAPRSKASRKPRRARPKGSGSTADLDDVERMGQRGRAAGHHGTRRPATSRINETEEIDLKASETQVGPLPDARSAGPPYEAWQGTAGQAAPDACQVDQGQRSGGQRRLNKFFKRR